MQAAQNQGKSLRNCRIWVNALPHAPNASGIYFLKFDHRCSEFSHQAVGLVVWICAEGDENLVRLGEIDPPFPKFNSRDQSVLPPQRHGQIPLRHVRPASERADVLAEYPGKNAVSRLEHALIFGAERLASKMRAE